MSCICPIFCFFVFCTQALGGNKTHRNPESNSAGAHLAPQSTGQKDLVCHTPCCHGHYDKGLNRTEMPMQHRRSEGAEVKKGEQRGKKGTSAESPRPTNALHRGPKLPPTQWSYSQFWCTSSPYRGQHKNPSDLSPVQECLTIVCSSRGN